MKNKLVLNHIERVSPRAMHSAFTDLIASPFDKTQNMLLCCFRQASDHVSQDGYISVVEMSKNKKVKRYQRLSLPGWDLRDPKFSFDGHRLIITAYAKFMCKNTAKMTTKMVSFFTLTGQSWSSMHSFGQAYWWLWNTSFYQGQAYGFAYRRAANRIDLYTGHPCKTMHLLKPHALSLQQHGRGYPNESQILFDTKGKATAIVRRDADTYTAQLGEATPPYTQWQWRDLGQYIGGPVMCAFTPQHFLVAGRDWNGRALSTKLWLLTHADGSLQELLTLPSAGDNSYPGMVLDALDEDTLYLSYYSMHIDQQARVYVATISGLSALKKELC